ncbi:MAG: UDP-N-acetylmuramoyl-tripeptide--D-alanyl-D-alanine ligase [Patescibacteria group bacterium]
MKKILKSIIVFILAFLARSVLQRYKPRIVMVSGSVGKTSTKDAVAAALGTKFYVRKSEKSFNSEFGVPFTILGVGNPWNDPFAWFSVLKSAVGLLILPNHYPTMLVLEVGADRPGDLARILRFAMPDAVVITRMPEIPVHVEAYASPEHVREEEFSPAYALSADASLIVPADDPWALEAAKRIPVRILSYGMSESATARINDIGFYITDGNVSGMQATITIDDEQETCVVKGSVGVTQLFSLAAALVTTKAFEVPLADALAAIDNYEAPPGRGRLLAGKNNAIIIDDSYNASPAAVEEALATLKSFPNAKRRIAVLGDMLELGRFSVTEHERIAVLAGESADMIVTVGIRARAFATAPKHAKVLQFDNSHTAASALSDLVRKGDVILVKGSQSIRTEHIVEALLADPSDVSKLVRQEKKWKQKL